MLQEPLPKRDRLATVEKADGEALEERHRRPAEAGEVEPMARLPIRLPVLVDYHAARRVLHHAQRALHAHRGRQDVLDRVYFEAVERAGHQFTAFLNPPPLTAACISREDST
jgi:hypothetical protein